MAVRVKAQKRQSVLGTMTERALTTLGDKPHHRGGGAGIRSSNWTVSLSNWLVSTLFSLIAFSLLLSFALAVDKAFYIIEWHWWLGDLRGRIEEKRGTKKHWQQHTERKNMFRFKCHSSSQCCVARKETGAYLWISKQWGGIEESVVPGSWV